MEQMISCLLLLHSGITFCLPELNKANSTARTCSSVDKMQDAFLTICLSQKTAKSLCLTQITGYLKDILTMLCKPLLQ